MSIDNFKPEYAGKYFCIAENDAGKVSKDVKIGIKLAPLVEVVPNSIEVNKGEPVTLECKVTNSDLDHSIVWTDEFGFTPETVKFVLFVDWKSFQILFLFRTERNTSLQPVSATTKNISSAQ